MQIKRDYYLNKLIKKMNNGRVKIVTGIRRCGKSYLLLKLFYDYLLSKEISKDQIITLTLEDEGLLRNRDNKAHSQFFVAHICWEEIKTKSFLTLFDLYWTLRFLVP